MNTFINKVQAEREVLGMVNRAYFGELQLAGLSASAIESWRSKVALSRDHPLVESLVSLATLAQTLSNRSNESFMPVDPGAETEIRRRLLQLPDCIAMAWGDYSKNPGDRQ